MTKVFTEVKSQIKSRIKNEKLILAENIVERLLIMITNSLGSKVKNHLVRSPIFAKTAQEKVKKSAPTPKAPMEITMINFSKMYLD